ncbi:MAG: hypothetical protein MJ183_09990 [Treponemataceae bacterium]|nr:hypothetical protein [Treponemataceae bacterium]
MNDPNNAFNLSDFTPVEIDEFYDADELKKQEQFSTDLVVLTEKERILVNILIDKLKAVSPETLEVISDRLADLERLTRNIAHFPSLLERHTQAEDEHGPSTLIDSLLKVRASSGSDKSLYLPSKAILGKGFLYAKFHVFMSMTKIANECGFSTREINEYRRATLNLMFTIMAEDVYLSLLDNQAIPLDLRQQTAFSLIILWEHRSDQNVADMAPVLETVWSARRKLAPVFGTMMGTSELVLLSFDMDDAWRRFITSKLGNPEVALAMEEFLFGLSYEEIQQVKATLRERGMNAMGRDEVAAFLDKEDEMADSQNEDDPRHFFLNYSVRRDNAKARLRMNLPGPHHTLEDHYMRFILEENKEKQYNDVFAR